MSAHCVYSYSKRRKGLPHMSLVYRDPRLLALLLVVLFAVLAVTFVILSFATHTNIWHTFLTLSPEIQCPCRQSDVLEGPYVLRTSNQVMHDLGQWDCGSVGG